MDKLKACPCCGGKATVIRSERTLIVFCTECGLSTADKYYMSSPPGKHIEFWNRRMK